jgi:hypothetical protein
MGVAMPLSWRALPWAASGGASAGLRTDRPPGADAPRTAPATRCAQSQDLRHDMEGRLTALEAVVAQLESTKQDS